MHHGPRTLRRTGSARALRRTGALSVKIEPPPPKKRGGPLLHHKHTKFISILPPPPLPFSAFGGGGLSVNRGGTYLQMCFFQPPLFVVVKFKIEKQHFIVFSKHFNPPRVVSIFHDLTQKLEFHTNFIRSVEG